jgi:phosphoribosyl-dephospho-CoA transferase
MFQYKAAYVRTHDLLEIDAERFLALHAAVPGWATDVLQRVPFLVVRRGLGSEQTIPVGVRGTERNQRWAAECSPALVKSITTPPQLLKRSVPMFRADSVPAFASLALLKDRWTGFDRPWGPGGSVGFELATSSHVARPESDLDIVIYAGEPITTDAAKSLCALASGLPAAVDIRVETRTCGFSLKEYATQGLAPILLRTPHGVKLASVPWSTFGESEGSA